MKYLATILLIFLCSCESKEPLDSSKAENPVAQPIFPNEAPGDWLLAHVDVETTGLVPGFHEMIDIGIVMTDLDGGIIDSLFLRIQPQHPERLSEGAFKVNAFNPERWKKLQAFSPAAAVDSIIKFHNRVAGDKQVLMVAFNSHFDAAFLDHLFRSVNKTWRELYFYFILDIPSMAWGLGFRDLTVKQIMEQYSIADEPHVAEQHTGITGAKKNVRVYQALVRYRKELSKVKSGKARKPSSK